MNRCRAASKRYTAMELCPSFAFFSGFGPTMNDAVTTNLHLKCCPARPPADTGVPVLAHKPFGVRAGHLFHEVALRLRCHGCFADSQLVTNSPEVLGQVHITDFVWLDPQ